MTSVVIAVTTSNKVKLAGVQSVFARALDVEPTMLSMPASSGIPHGQVRFIQWPSPQLQSLFVQFDVRAWHRRMGV